MILECIVTKKDNCSYFRHVGSKATSPQKPCLVGQFNAKRPTRCLGNCIKWAKSYFLAFRNIVSTLVDYLAALHPRPEYIEPMNGTIWWNTNSLVEVPKALYVGFLTLKSYVGRSSHLL